jgi:hypothetical protein
VGPILKCNGKSFSGLEDKKYGHDLHIRYSFYASVQRRSFMAIKSRMRWVGCAARMGEMIIVYRILVGQPERKKPFRRPGRRWEHNIIMDVREVVDWIYLAQNSDQWRAVVNTVMNLLVP